MDFRHGRCAAVPLEGRVALADWDPLTDTVNVWTSHQAPHLFRTGIAEVFGVGESEVRVVSPDVGGGFGVKLASTLRTLRPLLRPNSSAVRLNGCAIVARI